MEDKIPKKWLSLFGQRFMVIFKGITSSLLIGDIYARRQ